MTGPLVSVLMAVYNGERHLEKSIPSILKQTYRNFEFIVIDDGSSDKTADFLEKYAREDSRLKVFSQSNTGLTKALNNGLEKCKGKYIARQDVDDVSFPQRLERQVAFMEENPDVWLLGTCCENVYKTGLRTLWSWHDERSLPLVVLKQTPFAHSTVMMQTDKCQSLGGYDPSFKTAQDMEFWMRFARHGKISMLKEHLVERYIDDESISARRRWRQSYDALRARWRHGKSDIVSRGLIVYYALRTLIVNLLPPAMLKSLLKWRRKERGRFE